MKPPLQVTIAGTASPDADARLERWFADWLQRERPRSNWTVTKPRHVSAVLDDYLRELGGAS